MSDFGSGARPLGRRRAIGWMAMSAVGATVGAGRTAATQINNGRQTGQNEGKMMTRKAFVYTELQISVPFGEVPWPRLNQTIRNQPGFLDKTWLAGVGTDSVGGFYSFDSVKNAQAFVTDYFPSEAREFGVAQTTRVFDATVVEEASRDMNSVHFDGAPVQSPGAFVYTEVQLHVVPFDSGPWRDFNPVLKQQPGLLSKTWLSGLNTGTPGGLYAFDSVENARRFALEYFPKEAAGLNAAFYTRVFDAAPTRQASQAMNSPFYA